MTASFDEDVIDHTTVESIALTENRFLGVAWKNGSVHSLCLATDPMVAQKIAQQSLGQKPARNDVFENIENLVRQLLLV